MDGIEHMNRQFLYSHPRYSTPSPFFLLSSQIFDPHLPIKIKVRESSNIFLIEAFLPGANWDDVHVSAASDSLKIFATLLLDEAIPDSNQSIHVARHVGSVTRFIHLPASIDPGAIESDFSEGHLLIRLPKVTHSLNLTTDRGNHV